MFMLEDVLLAVSQPPAFRTIAELHPGMGKVRDPADRAGVERLIPARNVPGLGSHAPLSAFDAQVNILAEKEEKVAEGSEDEEPGAAGTGDEPVEIAYPGNEREPFDLDRQYEKNV